MSGKWHGTGIEGQSGLGAVPGSGSSPEHRIKPGLRVKPGATGSSLDLELDAGGQPALPINAMGD